MANHKRRPNYKSTRSCGLCKPHKRIGNSKKMVKRQIARAELIQGLL